MFYPLSQILHHKCSGLWVIYTQPYRKYLNHRCTCQDLRYFPEIIYPLSPVPFAIRCTFYKNINFRLYTGSYNKSIVAYSYLWPSIWKANNSGKLLPIQAMNKISASLEKIYIISLTHRLMWNIIFLSFAIAGMCPSNNNITVIPYADFIPIRKINKRKEKTKNIFHTNIFIP